MRVSFFFFYEAESDRLFSSFVTFGTYTHKLNERHDENDEIPHRTCDDEFWIC